MKVICNRAALLDAVGLASGVVAARSPRPQLTCVKVVTQHVDDAGELLLQATDAEIALTLRVGQVDVEQGGGTLIPAQKLQQIVSAEDHETSLTLEADADACHIRGDDAEFRLNTYPADEFPRVTDFNTLTTDGAASTPPRAVFAIPSGELVALIRRTLFAAARETSRYAINGVLLNRDGKKLEMVATDGRRLARCMTTAAQSSKDEQGDASCIVPSKALTFVQKLVEDSDEPVHVAIGENQIVFAFGDDPADSRATLASNLVEGTFPPYEDVIPKDQDIRVAFDRDLLASAVRRAALLTNEESRGVRMAFNAADKTLQLSSRSPEMGDAKIDVNLASFEGDDIEIGFNPQFITDALKVVDTPEIAIELKASNKPGVLRSGPEFTYVVMPVSLT